MQNKKIQKLGGLCAIFEALIYLSAFTIHGAILTYPASGASSTKRLQFLADNQLILSVSNFTSYVLFGILLAVLAIAIYQRQKAFSPIFSQLAYVFGIIWVGLVIASGMIANIGLDTVIQLGEKDAEAAISTLTSINIVAEGLGGGNEIIGGVWVLLVSVISLKGSLFPKLLSYLGLLVGTAGIMTLYPLEIFTEIFGLSQIIWFIWIGVFLMRNPTTN